MNYSVKTFGECTYGRHALTKPGGPGDILHLWRAARPAGSWTSFHPTRLSNSYRPRHAALDDAQAMTLIARELSEPEWSPDTLDVIADYVRATGRVLA